jgi:hypothetical protein
MHGTLDRPAPPVQERELHQLYEAMQIARAAYEDATVDYRSATHSYWSRRLPVRAGQRCNWHPSRSYGRKGREPRQVEIVGFSHSLVQPGTAPSVMIKEIKSSGLPSENVTTAEIDELTM